MESVSLSTDAARPTERFQHFLFLILCVSDLDRFCFKVFPFTENTYTVHVFTGHVMGAGTDANVFVNIYGETTDTGERHLKKSNHLNKFEKGQVEKNRGVEMIVLLSLVNAQK